MSSYHKTFEDLKSKSLHNLEEIDIIQLLFEKNEAMKDLDFLDDNEENEEEIIDLKKYKTFKGKEINQVDNGNGNIILISERSCQQYDSILEKNISNLEYYIKKVQTMGKNFY